MALEKEMETYLRELPRLAAEENRYALIKDDEVIDILDSYEDALKAGYSRFQLEPFMVKQILSVEQIHCTKS
jgi:hypothetical protein